MTGIDRIRLVEQHSPEVARLARLVSLSSHVDPRLLRRARLKHFPRHGAALEAELWFSPLVRTREKGRIVLFPDAAQQLRHQLRETGDLAPAWNLVKETHADKPESMRVFEELLFQTSRGISGPEYERELRRILGPVLHALADPGRKSLARWAFTVASHVSVRTPGDPADILRGAANIYLYGRLPNARSLPSDARKFLLASSASVSIGLRLAREALEISDPPESGSQMIEIPDITPRCVQVRWWKSGHMQSEWVEWKSGVVHREIVSRVSTPFVVETLRGDRFEIRAKNIIAPSPPPRLGPRPVRFPNLLPALIDRKLQVREFESRYRELQEKRRPMVVIIHGDRREAHHYLVERLVEQVLPRLLSTVERDASVYHRYADFPAMVSSAQLLREALLAEFGRLLDRPPASEQDIMRNLAPQGRNTSIGIRLGSRDETSKWLAEFCAVWDEWPELPARTSLVVWLLVTYEPSTGFLSRFSGDSTNRRLRNDIANLPSRFTRTIVLSELEPVSVEDFVEWYAGYVEPIGRVRFSVSRWVKRQFGETDRASMDEAMTLGAKLISIVERGEEPIEL